MICPILISMSPSLSSSAPLLSPECSLPLPSCESDCERRLRREDDDDALERDPERECDAEWRRRFLGEAERDEWRAWRVEA